MSDKKYYLVIHEVGRPKGVIAAVKTILSKQHAELILRDAGNPTITRKEDGSKYLLTDRRMFEYGNTDGTTTLFIICDGVKQNS